MANRHRTEPAPWVTVGQRIRVFREANDLTQQALAAKLYVSQPAVSAWERGLRVPSRATQFALADALRTTRFILFREVVLAENEAAA